MIFFTSLKVYLKNKTYPAEHKWDTDAKYIPSFLDFFS